MPTYDYECDKCKNVFEVVKKMSDPEDAACPKCGGNAHRIFSSSLGIQFRGAGFYANDSKPSCKGDGSPKCESCPHKAE